MAGGSSRIPSPAPKEPPRVAGGLSRIEHSPRNAYAAFREPGRSVADDLRRLYYDCAASSSPASLAAMLEITDPDHLVYGGDSPSCR